MSIDHGLHWVASLFLLAALCASCKSNAAPQASVSPEGTYWKLVEVSGKPVLSGTTERAPDLRFERETHQASGYAGVNNFAGPYELTGDGLKFGPLATTRRAGPPELMQQEVAVLAALDTCEGWRMTSGYLELLGATDALLLRYAPEEAPAAAK